MLIHLYELYQLQQFVNLVQLVSHLPHRVLSPGAEAPATVCEIKSLKIVRPFLNPYVLTLAILLPITSSFVWKFRRPEIPEYIERNIYIFPLSILKSVTASISQRLMASI